MGYLANIKLVMNNGNASIVFENSTEECETKAEAMLWASKVMYETALHELQTRINEFDD